MTWEYLGWGLAGAVVGLVVNELFRRGKTLAAVAVMQLQVALYKMRDKRKPPGR